MLITAAALTVLVVHGSITTAQTVDVGDIATSLLQRFWPNGTHSGDVQFFHMLDSLCAA
jgi:hypothetical protein